MHPKTNTIITKDNLKKYEFIDNEFYNIKFENIDFTEIEYSNCDFIDVIFEECNLSNINFLEKAFHRVLFVNCKLIGTNFNTCSIKDMSIISSNAKYMGMANLKIKGTLSFKDSDLTELSFIDNEFKKIEFDTCNITKGYFYGISLRNVDFTSSVIDDIRVDLNTIKGAVINHIQCVDVCEMLGLNVK